VDFHWLTVNELISVASGQRNQYCKYSLLYECQFQDFQNILKYILSQLSLLNLVSLPTPCWFEHCPLLELFDSSQCLCFNSLQIADRTQGLPKTWCGLLHPDCSWINPKPAVWCAPCNVCGPQFRPLDSGGLKCWLQLTCHRVIWESIISCKF